MRVPSAARNNQIASSSNPNDAPLKGGDEQIAGVSLRGNSSTGLGARSGAAARETRARRSSVDLSILSTAFLSVAKARSSTTQEIQMMDAGSGKLRMSSNSKTAAQDALDTAVLFNTYVGASNKKTVDLDNKLKQKFAKLPLKESLPAGEVLVVKGDKHAEQNLLTDFCKQLRNAEAQGNIESMAEVVRVFGAKPPCNICSKVMMAFENTLFDVYGIQLRYSGRGGDTSVLEDNAGLLTADDIRTELGGSSDMGPKFEEFLAAYAKNLAP